MTIFTTIEYAECAFRTFVPQTIKRSSDFSRFNAIFIHLENMLNPKCHKLEATLFYMFANKAHNILCDWDAFKLRAHVGNVFVVSIYCIYSLFLKYICAMRQTCSKLRLNLCSAIEHLVLPACVGNFDFQFTVSTVGNLIVWWRVYVENILPILVIAIPLSLNFVLMVM